MPDPVVRLVNLTRSFQLGDTEGKAPMAGRILRVSGQPKGARKGSHSGIGDAECMQPRHRILTAQLDDLQLPHN